MHASYLPVAGFVAPSPTGYGDRTATVSTALTVASAPISLRGRVIVYATGATVAGAPCLIVVHARRRACPWPELGTEGASIISYGDAI